LFIVPDIVHCSWHCSRLFSRLFSRQPTTTAPTMAAVPTCACRGSAASPAAARTPSTPPPPNVPRGTCEVSGPRDANQPHTHTHSVFPPTWMEHLSGRFLALESRRLWCHRRGRWTRRKGHDSFVRREFRLSDSWFQFFFFSLEWEENDSKSQIQPAGKLKLFGKKRYRATSLASCILCIFKSVNVLICYCFYRCVLKDNCGKQSDIILKCFVMMQIFEGKFPKGLFKKNVWHF